MYAIKKDVATPLVFLMISNVDHISPITGITPTVLLSKNGGTFAAPVGSVSEIGNGWYSLSAEVGNVDTLGPLVMHATGAGADPTDVVYFVTNAQVDLGPIQYTTIVGNIQGAVGSVTNPVTCRAAAKRCCNCC